MDSLTISPDVMRQMARNQGAGVAPETVQNAREQAEPNGAAGEARPDSDTAPEVGRNVDVKA